MSELDVVEPGINVKGQPDNTTVTENLLRAETHRKCRNPIPSWEREQRHFCLQSNLPKFLPAHCHKHGLHRELQKEIAVCIKDILS